MSSLSEINIDGKKISLPQFPATIKTVLNNMAFGVFSELSEGTRESQKDYFLVTGKLTAENDIPKSGNATYLGKAYNLLFKEAEELDGTDYDYGSPEYVNAGFDESSASFKVDFTNKTMNGEIQGTDHRFKFIEAKIKGNSFFGNRSHPNAIGSPEEWIRGNFFGKNASELGGVWSRKLAGRRDVALFGATKQ